MVVVSERFENLASSLMRSRGKPSFPMVVLPSDIEEMSDEYLGELSERTFPEIAEKLAEG